ncbi:MAG: protein kinase [Myxococcales bacterium]
MGALVAERFELIEAIGSGGFGTVYRALDHAHGREVAIKLLHQEGTVEVGRFEREAALLAEVRHPNLVRYIAHGRAESDKAFLVMEWLEGHTLLTRLRTGWLTLADVAKLAARVVSGLQAIAERGLVHRDIKPANLFLPRGRVEDVKLLDFGLARRIAEVESPLSRTGVLLGTPLYMSPEQARGARKLDDRSDVFSLGSVLFECLCGMPPFEADTALATLGKICFEAPPSLNALRPDVSPALENVVLRMLEKESSRRPTFAELSTTFQAIESASQFAYTSSGDIALNIATQEIAVSTGVAPSLRPRAQQRVISAVFVGPSEDGSERRVREILNGLRHRFGARCECLLSGALILLLERQTTPNEQAHAAAQCALSLRELLPDSPIAVCMGKAQLEGVLMGSLLEAGAHLLEQTPEGLIRLDDAMASLLEVRFDLRGPQGRRVLERERVGGETPRTLLGSVTPFVGRERELQQLDLLLGECREESMARAVLVTAPAGAGKSRLRFEFLQRLRQADANGECVVLLGAGDSLRSGSPFSALIPTLRDWMGMASGDAPERKRQKLSAGIARVVPATRAASVTTFLAEVLSLNGAVDVGQELREAREDPQTMADRVRASWLEWLGALARTQPLVLVIDDLHWADLASVGLLEHCLRTLENRAVMVFALARPEVRERFPKLWVERNLTELHLSRLGAKACEKLILALPTQLDTERRRWLIERADGNPFFLEELIRSDSSGSRSQELPDTVLGTIQARLDALGEDAKLVLRIASVFGQEFRFSGLESLLGTEARRLDLEGWLAVLVDKELLFERGSGDVRSFVFRHALVRDAAYALLVDSERTLAHRLAAHWLASRGDTESALLAQHYELGGELRRAAEAYVAAAMRAFEAHAVDEVIRLGESAKTCGAQGSRFFELCSMVAEALSWRDRHELSASWARLAHQGLPTGAPGWWRASQVMAIKAMRDGDRGTTEVIAEEMLAEACHREADAEQLIALGLVAYNSFIDLQVELALRLTAAVGAPKPEYSPRTQHALVTLQAFVADAHGDVAQTIAHTKTALTWAQRAGAAHEEVSSLCYLAEAARQIGDYAAVESWAQQAMQHPESNPAEHKFFLEKQGYVALQGLDYARAERLLVHAVTAFREADMLENNAWTTSDLAMLYSKMGDQTRALALCDEAAAMAVSPPAKAYTLAMAAEIKLANRQVHAARKDAEALEVFLLAIPFPAYAILFLLVQAECFFAAEEPQVAEQKLREAHALVLHRAGRIDDPKLRASFLEVVPYNAKVLRWAHEWLGLTNELPNSAPAAHATST